MNQPVLSQSFPIHSNGNADGYSDYYRKNCGPTLLLMPIAGPDIFC